MSKKKFDSRGLLFAINEIEKAYKIPLPEMMEKCGLCTVCLGANVPGQQNYPKDGWRCGSWCDHLLPAWKICERFKADRQKIKDLAKSIRPDGTEKASSSRGK